MEQASKSSQSYVVNDVAVQGFLDRCRKPAKREEVDFSAHSHFAFTPVEPNPIEHIVAVDSGFTEVAADGKFPSSTLAFFQYGALTFSVNDLEGLASQPFIDPGDIARLKKIERLKLVLPVKNVMLANQSSLTRSVRVAMYEFFCQPRDGTTLLETLRWFLFEEYQQPVGSYDLATCPECEQSHIVLDRDKVDAKGTVPCSSCGQMLYLTDVFRLHEAIEDEIGAGGILGYVTTLLEQLVMVHFIRLLLSLKPTLMNNLMFIKDGPLAFFGQTANMHKKMRELVRYLLKHHNLFMAGLEKSGAFVDHATEIASVMPDGSVLILDNDYIYKYIIPGRADASSPYGRTTYYSGKLIFKSRRAAVHVVTVPTLEPLLNPTQKDFANLDAILTNLEKLRCDMYDDALIPIALVNKLVSLANHPSSKILQRFAADSMRN